MSTSKLMRSFNLFTPFGFLPFVFMGVVFATNNSCFRFKLLDNNGYTFLCNMLPSCISIILVPSLHHRALTMPAPCVASTWVDSANTLTWSFIGRSSRVTDSHPFNDSNNSLALLSFLNLGVILVRTIKNW